MKGYKYTQMKIKGKLGRFKLWIADSDAKRVKGLSGIRNLNRNEGMIFIYPEEDFRTFTMKNTFIPLQIIFCDKNFKVLQIEKGKPRSPRAIQSRDKAKYVIEILDK
tara:strand:+ start:971 stop:1291 length:321 start_codon:yes stop_codon:yes gene_type:complete